METILLLLHTEPDGTFSRTALESVSAARNLAAGEGFSIGLVGQAAESAVNLLAGSGAKSFLVVAGETFAQPRYSTDAMAAEAMSRKARATLVLAPATSRWNRVLAGVAHRLGGRADTHVTGVNADSNGISIQRWYYRQRMEADLRRTQRPWFILVESGNYPAWIGQPGEVQVELLNVETPAAPRTTIIGVRQPSGGAQTIRPEAKLLFVAGAGWSKKQADGQPHVQEAERLISECLKVAQASLGSTKSLVDLGGEGQAVLSFLTHFNQVGQTGSTPRHPKGLATCCHGEEPHTVGWRFISERRAVNLDPGCGWARGKADVLYVADAFAVVRHLNELLKETA